MNEDTQHQDRMIELLKNLGVRPETLRVVVREEAAYRRSNVDRFPGWPGKQSPTDPTEDICKYIYELITGTPVEKEAEILDAAFCDLKEMVNLVGFRRKTYVWCKLIQLLIKESEAHDEGQEERRHDSLHGSEPE